MVRTCRISSAGPATAGQSSTVPKSISSCALHIHVSLQTAKCPISSDSPSYSPSAPQETERMDVEEEELAGSIDDHDGTGELNTDRAGMLVF